MAAWEEERQVSKYAEGLEQLPADGRVIPMDPAQVRGRRGVWGSGVGCHASVVPSAGVLAVFQQMPTASTMEGITGWQRPHAACVRLGVSAPPPLQWRCEETGVTDNLWLNLSTGVIGSGRQVRSPPPPSASPCQHPLPGWPVPWRLRHPFPPAASPPPPCLPPPTRPSPFPSHSLSLCPPPLVPPLQNWDGTGGNGSAMRHFEATGGKYPLVVKLGTITPAGADVFSYAPDEGDMVTDPHLARHLAHWGIDMARVRGARGAGAGGAGGGGDVACVCCSSGRGRGVDCCSGVHGVSHP